MKKVIINGRFCIHRVTGVERYARELVSELDKIVKPGEFELAVPPGAQNLPTLENIHCKVVGKLHNRLWEHVSFPLYVMQKGISLNLCNVAPLISPGIVCIHDVKNKARPYDFSRKFRWWYTLLFANECKRAKKILTVSEFSKKEICRYFRADPDKIRVIPNAWQHYNRVGYDENALTKYGLEKGNYFFSMSSLEPNKNFRWIAEAAKADPDQVYAVAGSVNKTVFAEGLGFQCPENMLLLGYVGDEEAKTLMKYSRAFVFPTYYEGFGLPPLEALSAGTKNVFVSDTEVMHEVFGKAVNYIDPYRFGKFSDALPPDGAEIDSVLGKYSWKKSAECLLKAIEETVKE